MLKIVGRLLAILLVVGLVAGGLYLLANSSAGSFLGLSHEREFRAGDGDGLGFQGNFDGAGNHEGFGQNRTGEGQGFGSQGRGQGQGQGTGRGTRGQGQGLGLGSNGEGLHRDYNASSFNYQGILRDLGIIALITLVVLGVQKAFKLLSHKKDASAA